MNPARTGIRPGTWHPLSGTFASDDSSDVYPSAQKPSVNPTTINLPDTLGQLLSLTCAELRSAGHVTAEKIREVVSVCKADGSPDYGRLSGAFTDQFFKLNFQKAASVIASEQKLLAGKPICRILELGSGSGASTAGLIHGLLTREEPPSQIIIDSVESNPAQIELFNRIVRQWVARNRLPVELNIECESSSEFLRERTDLSQYSANAFGLENYDLVVSAYMITELAGPEAADLALNLMLGLGRQFPRFLFLGSYSEGDHFGYFLSADSMPRCTTSAVEVVLSASGVLPSDY